eukprot:8155160-Pyramimonas_sp.AAC.1
MRRFIRVVGPLEYTATLSHRRLERLDGAKSLPSHLCTQPSITGPHEQHVQRIERVSASSRSCRRAYELDTAFECQQPECGQVSTGGSCSSVEESRTTKWLIAEAQRELWNAHRLGRDSVTGEVVTKARVSSFSGGDKCRSSEEDFRSKRLSTEAQRELWNNRGEYRLERFNNFVCNSRNSEDDGAVEVLTRACAASMPISSISEIDVWNNRRDVLHANLNACHRLSWLASWPDYGDTRHPE